MENESNAFYVIRKGDVVGVYKSLSDCQDQASSSICDPSVSVYKGYSLTKETETYLASRGLKNPLYVMKAADVKEDTFGTLVPCPFQQPDVHASNVVDKKITSQKRTKQMMNSLEAVGSTSNLPEQPNKFSKVEASIDAQPISSKYLVCTLQFDGASKGNPGPAGAGAVLLASDGRVVCRLREGLGTVTNNVAEYRALILGLKYALQKGFRHIQVYGDSKLVCMQVKGVWQTKNANMIDLCKEARRLKDMFTSFTITHVLRDLNTEADTQANLAINLSDGQVEELAGEL